MGTVFAELHSVIPHGNVLFLSGWFFDIQRTEFKLQFVIRKVRGLWLPYVKWMMVFILLHNVFCGLHCYGAFRGGSIPGVHAVTEIVFNLIRALTFQGENQLLGGFWFIPVLFYAAILSLFAIWFVKRICKTVLSRYCLLQANIVYIAVIIGFIIVAMLMLIVHKGIPMFILPNIGCKTMLACASFVSGALVKITKRPTWIKPLPFVIVVTLLLFVSSNTRLASVSILKSPLDAPYALFMGVLGGISWMIVSRWLFNALNKFHLNCLSSLILYIGRNTLVILALHFLCFKFINLFKVWWYVLDIEQVGSFPILVDGDLSCNGIGWVLLYVLAGVMIPITLAYGKDVFARFILRRTMERNVV